MTLKVVSFNIRNGRAQDGDNAWPNRIPLVHDLLNNLHADVIGLQEAFKYQVDDIMLGMPDFDWAGIGREDGKEEGEYACVLYRRSQFELKAQHSYWFSDTPDVPGSVTWQHHNTRICTCVRLVDPHLGNELEVQNLHLDHESLLARTNSVRMLVDRLPEGVPTLVMGDFNAFPSSDEIGYLSNGEVLKDLAPLPHGQGTYHGFTGNADLERIDFIFGTKEMESLSFGLDARNYDGRFPSDHYPIWAQIRL